MKLEHKATIKMATGAFISLMGVTSGTIFVLEPIIGFPARIIGLVAGLSGWVMVRSWYADKMEKLRK